MEEAAGVESQIEPQALQHASMGRRLLAIVLDFLLFGLPSFCLVLAWELSQLRSRWLWLSRMATGAAILVVVTWGYLWGILGTIYEAVMLGRGGQTLGKKAFRIKVVTPEGARISPRQAWGRAITRNFFLLLHPLGTLMDLLPALFRQDKTCLHDMVAETRVVRV